MASELKKAKKAVDRSWEMVCFYDAVVDGLDYYIEQAETLLVRYKEGSVDYLNLRGSILRMKELSKHLHEHEATHKEEYSRARLRVEALEKTERVVALRAATPGLYIREGLPEGTNIYAAAVYRYGGAGVWMENQKTIDLEDVPWPLVKLEVKGE